MLAMITTTVVMMGSVAGSSHPDAPSAVVKWPEVMNPPTREVVTELVSGGSPQEVAENLAEKILAEKVL